MHIDRPTCLREIVDAASRAGVYIYRPSEWLRRDLDKAKTPQQAARMLFPTMCVGAEFDVPGAAFGRGEPAAWERNFDANAYRGEDGAWIGSVNIAKLLCLPSADPHRELLAVKDFFDFAKAAMAAHPERRLTFQFTNNRDSGGRVYGDVNASWHDTLKQDERPAPDSTLTDAAKAKLTELGLEAWPRGIALALGKLGPWSWWTLGEAQLFPYGERPHHDFVREALSARRKAEAAAAKAATTSAAPAEPSAPTSAAPRARRPRP